MTKLPINDNLLRKSTEFPTVQRSQNTAKTEHVGSFCQIQCTRSGRVSTQPRLQEWHPHDFNRLSTTQQKQNTAQTGKLALFRQTPSRPPHTP